MSIIKIDYKDKYKEYEELLLKKEKLRKEAFHIKNDYIHHFGDLLYELYRYQIEIIKLKKSISFCIQKVNNDEHINMQELDSYIEYEMKSYYEELEELLEEKRLIDESYQNVITPEELKDLKSIYYKIAKLIHPDLYQGEYDETIKGFWENACIYYEFNDLSSIKEVYDATVMYLEDYNVDNIEIESIDEKILKVKSDIDAIIKGVPYILKYYMLDEETINSRKKEIQVEIDNCIVYIEELNEELNVFEIESVVM